MTNYERICADKAFCAWLLYDESTDGDLQEWTEWLDAEQREVNAEIERAIEFMYGERTHAASLRQSNTDERVIELIDRIVVYYDLAMQVLRAELDREKNEPLTAEELQSIIGKPYFHVSLESDAAYWRVFENEDAAKHPKEYHYGERWLAYRYEPKGEKA
jgi:hypothetical protein